MKQAAVTMLFGLFVFGTFLVAIWASIGDAPWESSAVEVQVVETTENTDAMRCEQALKLRNTAYNKYPTGAAGGGIGLGGGGGSGTANFGSPANKAVFQKAIDKAEAEIVRFC